MSAGELATVSATPLQIVGRQLADPVVLAASAAFEAAASWAHRRPPSD